MEENYNRHELFPKPSTQTNPNISQEIQTAADREGPQFHETKVHHQALTLRGQHLLPDIVASILNGFFQVDQKWTCYRRNYFSVNCAFNFRNSLAEGPFYLDIDGSEELIKLFAVSISAKTTMTTNGENEIRGLVQHTLKRDKATESVPSRHLIAPTPFHTMGTNGTYSSAGHTYPSANNLDSISMGNFVTFETSGANSINTSHTFERIQFEKATANNGKRRLQQEYFSVVVELYANIGRGGEENWILIATRESEPIVVRGRSPGHYKDNGRETTQPG